MKLSELLTDISYRCASNLPRPDTEIAQIATSPAQAGPRTLFLCTRTALRDGHVLANEAYARGCRIFLAQRTIFLPSDAVVLMCEDTAALALPLTDRLLGYPSRHLTLVGVTGTVGKSNVGHLLHGLLCAAGRSCALVSREGLTTKAGFLPFGETVPDGVRLAHCLQELLTRGVEVVILECYGYMLLQGCGASLPFTALLCTDLSPDLLPADDRLDTREYLAAFRALLASDCPAVLLPAAYADTPTERSPILFGKGGAVQALNPVPFSNKCGYGTRFTLFCEGEETKITLPVPGEHAVQNALAAFALALVLGISQEALPTLLPHALGGVMPHCVTVVAGRFIYRDTAYTPSALARTLALLRERTEGRLTVLLGSVGGRAEWRRAPLAKTAEQHADFVYLTADDPDAESPAAICEEMAAAFTDPSRFVILPDRASAIRRAVLELRPGDTLLLAGKGRERTQLIAGERLPFDEEALILQAAGAF